MAEDQCYDSHVWMCLAVSAMVAIATAAQAQTAAVTADGPRVEIWGSVSASLTQPSGTVVSSYSPPLLADGEFTSLGRQTLTFTGRSATGFEAGINLFLFGRTGFQVLVDRASMDVSGINGPYDVTLTYTSRPPPDYQPQIVNTGQSTPWPDTSGSVTRTEIAVNAVRRVGHGRVTATLSGGLSAYSFGGSVQPLAYTTFRLGGHSVLFQDDYRLAVSLDADRAWGFNAGGELNVAANSHVALMAGFRFSGGPTRSIPVRVTTILNADQLLFQQSASEIAQQFGPRQARVGVSGARIVVGMKLMR